MPEERDETTPSETAPSSETTSTGVTGREIALWGVLFTVAIVLTVAVFLRRQAEAALPVYNDVPDFSFVNRDGRTITRADLLGQPWVADFIFTRCPGICPRMTRQMRRVEESLPPDSPVRLVSFSVDPDYDSPEVLDEFARRFEAGEDWLFLNGPKETVHALSREGFLLALDAVPASNVETEEWITHSSRFALVDGAARIRGYYDSFDDADIDRLLAEIDSLTSR